MTQKVLGLIFTDQEKSFDQADTSTCGKWWKLLGSSLNSAKIKVLDRDTESALRINSGFRAPFKV